MIHVLPQKEPPDFDVKVRQPGRRALAAGRDPLSDYWRNCLHELMNLYKGICAYACIYIPPVVGGRSVEHFAPKSKHRDLAYEWTNYRLVCGVMNSRKKEFEDVIDPFEQIDGWFQIQLTSMKVFPAEHLTETQKTRVQDTIARLKLNEKDCRDARAIYYDEYLAQENPLPFRLLKKWSPFVAREVERQGLRRTND